VRQFAYALAPRPTAHLIGAVFRWLLSRARRAEKTPGTLLEAAAQGPSAAGGWLVRKKLPPVGELTKLALWALGAVVVGVPPKPPGDHHEEWPERAADTGLEEMRGEEKELNSPVNIPPNQ